MQLKRELEADKNRQAMVKIAEVQVEVQKAAAEKARADAEKAKAQASMAKVQSEANKIQADMDRLKMAADRQEKYEKQQADKQEKANKQRIMDDKQRADLQEKADKQRIMDDKAKDLVKATTAWEEARSAALDPLYSARRGLIKDYPFPDQNGKKMGDVIQEMKEVYALTKDKNQKAAIQSRIAFAQNSVASLNYSSATKAITETEGKIKEIDEGAINPTAPNGKRPDGRWSFKTFAIKNAAKTSLQKDLEALVKYNVKLTDIQNQITEVSADFDKKKPAGSRENDKKKPAGNGENDNKKPAGR